MPETELNQGSTSTAIDASNPCFISNSDHPGSLLISTAFTGIGFASWKKSMIISLSAKNKLGFVDGSITAPNSSSSTFAAWHQANSMVISRILNSLAKNIADSVLFLDTAHAIWKELCQRYEQSDGAMIYQVQQQLYSISQGSDDFSSYFTKITCIWDELRLIQSIPTCSCSASASLTKFIEEQKLIQLLMGLDDSYKVVRGQLLVMKPLPSLSSAYSVIIQEERQRGITAQRQRGITAHPHVNADTIAMAAAVESNSYKKSLVCNHCKNPGHSKAQCYRLHGFPSNFKFTKSKRDDNKKDDTHTSTVAAASTHISEEQYTQLIQLLNQNNLTSSSNSQVNRASLSHDCMNPEGPFIHE